jgi:NAD(P)H-hydrate epimerase
LGDDTTELLNSREKFSHKGKFGRALMMAGSYGMMGAAVLSSRACLRSGAGLLTTYVPKCGYEILQTSVPEAMCLTDQHEGHLTTIPDVSIFDSIGIGPGLGKNEETKQVIHALFKQPELSLVIDADALNLIAEDDFLKQNIPDNTILTPHPLEFKRLVGDWKDSREKLKKQMEFSKKNNCVVVLKGAHTSVSCSDGNVYFNLTGNPGMATAGSGDVLTGIITGLRAQGYSAIEAAVIGVHFHGKAGDMAKKELGENGMIASDLITHLRIEKN